MADDGSIADVVNQSGSSTPAINPQFKAEFDDRFRELMERVDSLVVQRSVYFSNWWGIPQKPFHSYLQGAIDFSEQSALSEYAAGRERGENPIPVFAAVTNKFDKIFNNLNEGYLDRRTRERIELAAIIDDD